MTTSRDTVLLDATPSKYAITETKKQEIDRLTQEVLDAEHEVEQSQAIVDSLTDKATKLAGELATAEANKTQALNNKNSVDTVVNNALDLYKSSEVTYSEVKIADDKIKQVALNINQVVNKLIYSAEVIDKLSNLVIRKKAMNPLISDELVTMVTQASSDANNAVSLALVALESVFTSQATTIESEAAMSLELLQATKLYEYLTGENHVDEVDNDINTEETSLRYYLYRAYDITSSMYEEVLAASNDNTDQLNDAKATLSKAQINLSSLQAGLAAANAAALAS
jgi:SMC interacting uncharacterized protein involved in chromosome segregation